MTNSVFGGFHSKKTDVVAYKNIRFKKNIIKLIDKKGPLTLNCISAGIKCSIPKSGAIVQELIEEELIEDLGKMETEAGRKPQLYGLISHSILFVGVHVRNDSLDFGIVDLNENVVLLKQRIPFELENTQESLDNLCHIIGKMLDENKERKERVATISINLPGRVNRQKGVSNNYFNFTSTPLTLYFKAFFGVEVLIDNDTRAKAYCEFHARMSKKRRNILYINADYGLGLGALVEGRLQYGKSGYSGEFGHIPFFKNNKLCRCGRVGCLETEVSGIALIEQFKAMMAEGHTSPLQKQEGISLKDIVMSATENEDLLAIELIGEMARKLGVAITTLIHIYNPDTIVLGGTFSLAGDFFMLPVKLSIFKHALSRMRSDIKIELPSRFEGAGVVGACSLSKRNLLR